MTDGTSYSELEARVRNLENWKSAADERARHIDRRFDDIEQKIDSRFQAMQGYISRIAWAMFLFIFIGVVGSLFKGAVGL